MSTSYALLRFFEFGHLPLGLQATSKRFHDLAHEVAAEGIDPAETTVALRKLLEAKDAAVRSILRPYTGKAAQPRPPGETDLRAPGRDSEGVR